MSLEGWMGILATIGVAVLFYLLQKWDNKKHNNNSKEGAGEKKHKSMNLADINFVIPSKEVQSSNQPYGNASVFRLQKVYNGYMTTIKYTNSGNCEARKVRVDMEQKEGETVSLTIIKNDYIFPIEILNVGDSFEIDVECYYPKANRYLTIEWEDKLGKHSQRNLVLLSKNYIV